LGVTALLALPLKLLRMVMLKSTDLVPAETITVDP
jgi:hypothetical protein